ncbi:TPA: hypothetical protein ACG4NT_001920 [Stenotrophomonas maltophilia]
MVDVKISGLPAAAALTGNEVVPAVQGGSNVKLLVSAIRAGLATSAQGLPSGGTAGQLVRKVGATDYAMEWFTPGAGMAASFATAEQAAAGAATGVLMDPALTAAALFGLLGMGGAGSNVASATDANTTAPGRVFRTTGATLNLPSGLATDGVLLHLKTTGDQVLQLFSSVREASATNYPALWVRGKYGSTQGVGGWGPWRKTADDGQVVHTSGNETISGDKTWNGIHTWNLASAGSVEYGTPTGLPGIVIRNGNPSGGANVQWRTDIRGGAGFCNIVVNDVVGNITGGARGLSLQQTSVRPTGNNILSCGDPSARWTELHATNGTVNTSDARLKTPLVEMSDSEEAAFLEIGLLPMKWQWLHRVEEEGDAARWHGGPAVQAAIAVMESHGLDAFSYSAFCYDSWPAQDEVWREWAAEAAEVIEWPAEPEQWADIPAELDDAGEVIIPARRELIHPATPAGRVVMKEAIEAGRELVQPAVAAGDSYSFRVSELHAWILAATARRDRREREAAERRMASMEQRLAALESGK